MVGLREDVVKDTKQSIVLGIYVVVMTLFVVVFLLFGGRGIEERVNLDKVLLFGGVLGGLSLFFYVLGKSVVRRFFPSFQVVLHDPEIGVLSRFKFVKRFPQFLHLSLIIGVVMGLLGASRKLFFTAIPSVEQQVAKFSQLGLAVEPASSTETLAVIGIPFSLLTSLNFYFSRKKKLYGTFVFFFFQLLIIPLIIMFIWIIYHSFRYGASDVATMAVAIFGFFSAFILALTGSIIFPVIWHITNNFFGKLVEVFGAQKDLIIVYTILVLIILIGSYVWLWVIRKNVTSSPR